MQNEKKKNTGLIVAVIVLIIVVLGLIGYLLLETQKKENNKGDHSDYLSYNITTKEDFKAADTIDEKYISEFKLVESFDFRVKYDESKKKAYFVFENKNYDINISDVKHVYAYINGCSEGDFSIYILTSSGNVYYLESSMFYDFDRQEEIKNIISSNITQIQKAFKQVNKNVKYEKLAEVSYDIGTTCGYINEMIGYDNNNNPYILKNEEKFVEECSHYIGMEAEYCIDLAGKVYKYEYSNGERGNKELTDIKVKKVINSTYVEALMLDENNYLYQYGLLSDVDGITKVSGNKVKKIYYKSSDNKTNYIIVFEDDSEEKFTINK